MEEPPTKQKKQAKGLEAVMAAGLFGTVLGIESNLQPLSNVRIKDTSFSAYVAKGKEQFGDGYCGTAAAYALSLWTYPGAKIGAAIHNCGLPEDY